MKKILAILLAAVMLLMCTACGEKGKKNDNADDSTYDINHVYEIPSAISATDVENSVVYFSLISRDYNTGENNYLMAYADESGNCYIEYSADVKKVAYFVPDVLDFIAIEFENTALTELSGQSVWADGERDATMYVEFEDGVVYSAEFVGDIPQDFYDGFEHMYDFFKVLTADIPVYVPQPSVTGDVDDAVCSEILSILNSTEIDNLDNYVISAVEADEYFTTTLGLSDSTGITNGSICQPLMITTPYSLVIVTVEDSEKVSSVCADFEANVDWDKWVCVLPSDALIAKKGNMALCLMAADELYNMTADAIAEKGWDVITELENPYM